MKALLLDGFKETAGAPGRLNETLTVELEKRGWSVQCIRPADHEIAWCHGEFDCWVKTPGVCIYNDMNREIARAMVGSDLLIYTTPITFGGYSSDLKKALDHKVQNIMPFFSRVKGETHHSKRYAEWPRFMSFGLVSNGEEEEATFRALTWRNALNMRPPAYACDVLRDSSTTEEMKAAVTRTLDMLESGGEQGTAVLAESILDPDPSAAATPLREVLLLVGSPRGLKSSSHALGTYLMERFSEKGIRVKTIVAMSALRSAEGMQELLTAADSSDLVVVAYPLYIDSLSGPLTRALEEIAAYRRQKGARGGRLAAIANSGFPEASQNRISLSICRNFARQAGFAWAGGLALGCGEAMVQQRPLTEGGGRTQGIRASLDIAARALAEGNAIPPEAAALISKKFIPTWLFRLIGERGWKDLARKNGVRNRMWDRPYEMNRA